MFFNCCETKFKLLYFQHDETWSDGYHYFNCIFFFGSLHKFQKVLGLCNILGHKPERCEPHFISTGFMFHGFRKHCKMRPPESYMMLLLKDFFYWITISQESRSFSTNLCHCRESLINLWIRGKCEFWSLLSKQQIPSFALLCSGFWYCFTCFQVFNWNVIF